MENILNNNDCLLGKEFQYQDNKEGFDGLPAEEQAERISNYIIKHNDGKKTIKELEEECKLEYNVVNGAIDKYKI